MIAQSSYHALPPWLQVEVLWVVSQRQSKWEAALPKETADLLNAGRQGSQGTLDSLKDQAEGFLSEKLGTSEWLDGRWGREEVRQRRRRWKQGATGNSRKHHSAAIMMTVCIAWTLAAASN
jgi:hypothetical protein